MHTFSRMQVLKTNLDEACEFFSNPENLAVITPPEMNFKIQNKDLPADIYPGMAILYKVGP